mmetsp:Transcript_47310/g.153564  ORF Transcript_47310/g.153564 Transcript_47310/m.153564 type:complete len:196 (-) Transcript_47310:328-915(-)
MRGGRHARRTLSASGPLFGSGARLPPASPRMTCSGVFVVSGMKLMSRHAPATGVPAARYDLPYWCSGTFVLDAGQSRRLLGTWREEILSGKVSLDQHALHRAVARGHAVCPLPDDTRYVKDLEGTLRGLLHTRTLLHFQTAKASLPDYCAARRGGCSAPATATAQQIVRIDVSAPPPGAARSGRGSRNATYANVS